jgi:hypothetical protein
MVVPGSRAASRWGIAEGVDVGFVMARQGGAQVVGNIGMYYAAYRLSQQGWNVMPTARNARGVAG